MALRLVANSNREVCASQGVERSSVGDTELGVGPGFDLDLALRPNPIEKPFANDRNAGAGIDKAFGSGSL